MLFLATSEAILNIFRNPSFENLSELTSDAQEFAIFLAPMIIMISLAWNFFNNWVNGYQKKSFFDYKKFRHDLIRVILIFLLPLMMKGIQGMFSTFRPKGEDSAKTPFLGISRDDKNAQVHNFIKYGGPLDRIILSYMQEQWLRNKGTPKMLVNIRGKLVHQIYTFHHYINYYLPTFIKLSMALMIVVSPLCAAFSILPLFRNGVENLLSTFIGLIFTFVSINVVDSLVYGDVFSSDMSFFETILTKLEVPETLNDPQLGLIGDSQVPMMANRMTIYLLFWISALGSYYLIFWFTSFFVGTIDIAIMMTIVSILANFHEVDFSF